MPPTSTRSSSDAPSRGLGRTVGGVLGGIAGLAALSTVAGVLVVTPLVPILAVGGQATTGAVSIFDGMPGYLEIDRPMLPTTIYTRDPETGEDIELTSFYDQNRSEVEFDEIAPVMFDAVLSAEDPRYYRHGGVDIFGTTRALISNVTEGGPLQGGSSISQQYVKNVLVQRCERDAVATETQSRDEVLQQCWLDATNATGIEGYDRKLQEIRYAVQLEREYSKPEILLAYLNIANFGGTTYGVEAAAQRYFGVSAADLTAGQAATLAGIVQNPNTYRIDMPGGSIGDSDGNRYNRAADGSVDDVTPGTLAGLDTLLNNGTITQEQYLAAGDAYSATKGRQLYVLDRMLTEGRITDEQYLASVLEPITPNLTRVVTGCADTDAAFFCQYVVNTVRRDAAYAETFGADAAAREQALTREGLSIYTTVDWRLQNAAQETVSQYAPSSVPGMGFGATSVSVEASTGRILAIAQNNEFSEDGDRLATDPGATSLIYAGDRTHGVSNGFETGSTFKLFTLVEWLEQGHSLYEPVDARVRPIPRLEDRCDGPWINQNDTVVQNFGGVGGGMGTPMQFTASSLNSGFLGMAEQLDMCDIEETAASMGVANRGDGQPVDLDGAASIIGTNNIAPVDMAAAYATVANNGVYCEPYVIERVVDADGNELPLPPRECTQSIAPDVAAATAYALEGVMAPGATGYTGNPNDGTPLIGKTGTHQTHQTWLVESSTAVATAVWVGNADGGQGDLFRSYYDGMRLSDLRTPIAREVQRVANELYPGSAFPEPAAQYLRRPAPPAAPEQPEEQDEDEQQPGQGQQPEGNGNGGNGNGNQQGGGQGGDGGQGGGAGEGGDTDA